MADSVKIRITGEDSEFRNTLSGIGKSAGSVFKGIMASQIVTKGLSLLTNGLRSAINTGMEFEAAMSQVAAISGATDAELQQLSDTAKHYGETTKFSASQAAEALNYMALAGWDAQQSMDALGGVLDLAAASGMELGAASDAVTDYLSAFGMEASKAGYMADMMAYAQSKSNTTAAMLADAYGNCASSMHSAGQDIETTTALLMSLANQGIKGSEAGTQLSAVMRDLTQKMENGNIKIGKTAVAVKDAQGNFRDLNDILTDVGRATEGMGTAEKSSALMETFTARSIKAINTLLNDGMANVNAYEDALRGSAGTAAEQAETMMDNLKGDVQIFQSALEGLQITASESTNGIARSMVQEATGILDAMNRAGKTGGIGGMADALLAQIPSLLPKLTKGVENLLGGLGKRLPGLVKNLIATVPDVLGGMGDMVPGLIDALAESLGAAVEGVIVNLPQITMTLAKGIGKSLISAVTGIATATGNVLTDLLGKPATEYKTWDLDGELTYAVSTDAEVDNSGAEAAVTAKWQEFVETLKGYGLTTEQIAQILAFKGTQAELEEYLTANFPNLDIAARNAIMEKFTVGNGTALADLFGADYGISAEDLAKIIVNTDMTQASVEKYLEDNFPDMDAAAKSVLTTALTANGGIGANLVSELKGLGIKPLDIVQIIAYKGEGNDAAIEALLKYRYSNIKDQAISAITSAWNESPAGFDTTGTGVSFSAGLIVDMFTNGKKDDKQAVDAALEQAKETIRAKKQELIDYINGGGEDQEGAQNALNLLEEYDKALTDYATNYANAATDVCEEAGRGLMELAAQCDEAVGKITAATEKLQSVQEILFIQGKAGAKLSEGDMNSALLFIATQYHQAVDAAAKAKEDALLAGADIEAANAAYEKALQDALGTSTANIAALLKGQAGNIDGLDVGAALTSVWDQIEQSINDHGGTAIQSEVEQILRNAGYGDDIVGKALAAVFGEQQYEGSVNIGALEGHDFGDDVNQLLADYIGLNGNVDAGMVADLLKGSGFGDDIVGQVLSELFIASDMTTDSASLASIIGGFDFGIYGDAIKTAIENGLIEGVDSADGVDVNQLVLKLIGDSLTQPQKPEAPEPVKVETPVELSPSEITTDATTGTKVNEAVREATESAPKQTVEATADMHVKVEGVTIDGGEAVKAAAQKVANEAAQSMGQQTMSAYNAGKNLATGLALGISAGRSGVINAARAVALAAVAAMKEALQINSPSKVTMRVGESVGEGFGMGMQDSLSAAIRAAQTVVGAANLSPKMDFSGLSTSMNGAINDLADLENSREWAFYLNGREMARASTRDYNTALNGYGKRISLGYGRG